MEGDTSINKVQKNPSDYPSYVPGDFWQCTGIHAMPLTIVA